MARARTYRKLVLDSGEWGWFCGRGVVLLLSPDGRSIVVDQCTLTGRDPNSLERGRWKKTTDGMITPIDVRSYIERELVPRKPIVKTVIYAPTYEMFVEYCVLKGLDPKRMAHIHRIEDAQKYDRMTTKVIVIQRKNMSYYPFDLNKIYLHPTSQEYRLLRGRFTDNNLTYERF